MYNYIQRCLSAVACFDSVVIYDIYFPVNATGIIFCKLIRGDKMAVSYKKLWKLLIDRDMKKCELCKIAGISPASVTKMGKNGCVTTDILNKICIALECDIEDIMEISKKKEVI